MIFSALRSSSEQVVDLYFVDSFNYEHSTYARFSSSLNIILYNHQLKLEEEQLNKPSNCGQSASGRLALVEDPTHDRVEYITDYKRHTPSIVW